jgi:hypothetical protein
MSAPQISNRPVVPCNQFARIFPADTRSGNSKQLAEILGDPNGPMVGRGGWNFDIPAGFTYLGQFIAHDLTSDAVSNAEGKNAPENTRNFRTPAFDLDSVYGGGPGVSPFLYRVSDPTKFCLGCAHADLPRTVEGTAIIGDARNDLNFFTSQLHVAFLNFHNYVASEEVQKKAQGAFARAQQLVLWHYQWIAWNEYLPKIVDPEIISDVVSNGPRFFRGGCMPVDFSVAAFRFGHSQTRDQYDIGPSPDWSSVHLEDLFGPNSFANLRPIDWTLFFPIGGSKCQFSRPIGPTLVEPLMSLPDPARGIPPTSASVTHTQAAPVQRNLGINPRWVFHARRGGPPPFSGNTTSLAYLDIRHGESFDLPSGDDVAKQMGLKSGILDPRVIWDDINKTQGVIQSSSPNKSAAARTIPPDTPVPLWLYILMEARHLREGKRLGPVGGRIVAEVFYGLLKADPGSYFSTAGWKPTLRNGGQFFMTDLLALANKGAKLRP